MCSLDICYILIPDIKNLLTLMVGANRDELRLN
jgi:hypothetical protein